MHEFINTGKIFEVYLIKLLKEGFVSMANFPFATSASCVIVPKTIDQQRRNKSTELCDLNVLQIFHRNFRQFRAETVDRRVLFRAMLPISCRFIHFPSYRT